MKTFLAARVAALVLLVAAPAAAQSWPEVGLTVAPARGGLQVTAVQPGTFADSAQLEVGDTIYSAISPRTRISAFNDLKAIADSSPGFVRLTVRKGTGSLVTVVVQVPAVVVPPKVVSYPSLGVAGLEVADGCKVTAPISGKALQLGIAVDDIITQINGMNINSVPDVAALTNGDFTLTVWVGGDRTLAVPLVYTSATPPPTPTWDVVIESVYPGEGVVWIWDPQTQVFENPPRAYLQPANQFNPISIKIEVEEGHKIVIVPKAGGTPRVDAVVDASMQVVAGIRRVYYPDSGSPPIPPPDPGGSDTRYDIEIYTGRMLQSPGWFNGRSVLGDGPGTDANVFVTIVGDRQTVAFGPYSGVGAAFDQLRKDVFTEQRSDVGRMREIHIRHDATNALPDWNLLRINITKSNGFSQESASGIGPTWLIGSGWLKFTLY